MLRFILDFDFIVFCFSDLGKKDQDNNCMSTVPLWFINWKGFFLLCRNLSLKIMIYDCFFKEKKEEGPRNYMYKTLLFPTKTNISNHLFNGVIKLLKPPISWPILQQLNLCSHYCWIALVLEMSIMIFCFLASQVTWSFYLRNNTLQDYGKTLKRVK